MEELKEYQIFMLYATLHDHFHGGQWEIISSQAPSAFLQRQQIILNKLLHEQKLFDKYFENFYTNHVKLLNWSVLAVEQKAQITPYVFKSLVNKGSSYFNRKIKHLSEANQKKEGSDRSELNSREIKDLQEQVYKQFFYEMVGKSKANDERIYNSQSASKKKQVENIDGHQFYIKTFNACNGWKYIFYNYEKHMKGQKQIRKYNDKIRPLQQRSFLQNHNRNNLGLLEYEHPQLSFSQTKVYNLNTVISNSSLNSINILKKLVKSSPKNKLCFRNHQGKPISYRACRT